MNWFLLFLKQTSKNGLVKRQAKTKTRMGAKSQALIQPALAIH
jgi:hypothetical protein